MGLYLHNYCNESFVNLSQKTLLNYIIIITSIHFIGPRKDSFTKVTGFQANYCLLQIIFQQILEYCLLKSFYFTHSYTLKCLSWRLKFSMPSLNLQFIYLSEVFGLILFGPLEYKKTKIDFFCYKLPYDYLLKNCTDESTEPRNLEIGKYLFLIEKQCIQVFQGKLGLIRLSCLKIAHLKKCLVLGN